jgi:hypothetical protein
MFPDLAIVAHGGSYKDIVGAHRCICRWYCCTTVLLQPKAVPVETASTADYRTMILADLTVVVKRGAGTSNLEV